MGFTNKTWSDRKTEYPNRRLLTKEDGSTELVTVSREEGIISTEGDAFSAENMNDLEDRIYNAFVTAENQLKNYLPKSGGTLTGPLILDGATSVTPDVNAAYSAPFMLYADYNSDKTKRAGLAFHNTGLNAAFMYLSDDGFHFMSNSGEDKRLVTNDEIGYLKYTAVSVSVSFSNGIATVTRDMSAHGSTLWGAFVCGLGTENTFACSNIDATITATKIRLQCVNNASFSGSVTLNILYVVQ